MHLSAVTEPTALSPHEHTVLDPPRWRHAAHLLPAIDRHGWIDDYQPLSTRSIHTRLTLAAHRAAHPDPATGQPHTDPAPTLEGPPSRTPTLDEVLDLLDQVADDADALNHRIQTLLAGNTPIQIQDPRPEQVLAGPGETLQQWQHDDDALTAPRRAAPALRRPGTGITAPRPPVRRSSGWFATSTTPPAKPPRCRGWRRLTGAVLASERNYGFDQLLKQVHGRLEVLGTSTTYDDRCDRHLEQTVAEVAADLNDALATARILAEQLSRAAERAGHLGVGD